MFRGVTAEKYPKKVYFMHAESLQKTLNIFNFITTYAAILMKLTTNMLS